jgi:hypothetical protein
MRCPQCKNRIIHKAGGRTRVRIHGPLEFDENGVCHSQCHWCRTPVELPLTLGPVELVDERFVIASDSGIDDKSRIK